MPKMVVCPNNPDEAQAFVVRAFDLGIPITPRGGGTGLAGGALGTGYIIDCSRLTEIQQISIDEMTVTCRPGVIYQDLNLILKDYGLFFPPDPSSGDSCQIGGMLANNSSGPRSVKYGLTSDYVEELTVIGKDKRPLVLKKLSLGRFETDTFLSAQPEYKEILTLLDRNRSLITGRWPKVKKNSSGYNLLQVVVDLGRGIFNLPALYVGSEGTLGLFLAARIRLLRLPAGNRSFRLFFPSLDQVG